MKTNLTLYLKEETIRKLEELAKKRKVSLSKVAEEILDCIIENKPYKN
jgi:predicted transcriptional regulator